MTEELLETSRLRRLIDLFASISQEIGVSLKSDETLDRALRIAVPELGDTAILVSILPNGSLKCLRAVRSEQGAHSDLVSILADRFDTFLEEARVRSVIRSGEPFRSADLHTLTLPVRDRGEIIGTLTLERESDEIYSETELALCQEFVARVGIALGNARLYETLARTEEQLIEARLAAEQANRAKTSFLANMSHEIRTPLTAILGFSEILASQASKSAENDEFATRIRHNGNHLMRIIDDVLNLAKVESGNFQLERKNVSLPDLLSNLKSLAETSAQTKQLAFELKCVSRLPVEFETDPTRLNQILLNLISNAIKFTSNGQVTLTADYKPRSGCITFSVTDTGPGLTEDQVQKLFKPFSQGDTVHSRTFGGTGLGLVLSRRFAQLLGGDVALTRTALNIGTTFEVSLPISVDPHTAYFNSLSAAAAADRPKFEESAVSLEGCQILFVDDSEDNRILVSRILRNAGANVTEARDGREALAKATDRSYCVILMDVQMPEIDGLTATSELRRRGYTGPILSLTAHALEEERLACLEAGCDGHLTKPVNTKELLRLVSHWSTHPSRYARA